MCDSPPNSIARYAGDVADFVDYLKKQVGPPSAEIKSVEEAAKLVNEKKIYVEMELIEENLIAEQERAIPDVASNGLFIQSKSVMEPQDNTEAPRPSLLEKLEIKKI